MKLKFGTCLLVMVLFGNMITLSEPQKYIFNSTQEINLFMGGTGSGKTYLDGCISADFVRKFPNIYGFLGSNTYEQLNSSTLKRIRDVWRDVYHWQDGKHYVVGVKPPSGFNLKYHNFDNYSSIISFKNGAVVFKGALENYEVHAGKEFGWAICDESWMTKEEAIREVILTRLRQIGININGRNICPLYITTTPSKVDWINEMFRLDDFENEILSVIYDEDKYFHKTYDNKSVAICSIYHNKANLPENYIPNLIKEHTDRNGKLKESGQRLIYANPFVKAGGEFYSSFDRIQHTTHVPYTPGLPLHISFDFNVVPYITMLVSQVARKENIKVRIIEEICLASPNNKTDKLCEEFIRRYREKLLNGLMYYGDATGKNQDTRGLNDYQIIEKTLRNYLNNYSKRVPYKNPPVLARRQFINNILDEKYNVRILIDRGCKELIRDLEFVKEDATGHKLKEKVKDPNTGQTYEKYGHCFVKGTKIETINGLIPIEDIRQDDLVLTRYGYQRVKRSFLSQRDATVRTYCVAGQFLTCTPDHPVFTNRGFIEIDKLNKDDLIFKRNDKWNQRQLFTTGSDLAESRNLTEDQIGYITKHGSVKVKNIYTDMYGKLITEKYQKDMSSITETGIPSIITSPILNVFQEKCTSGNTSIQCGCELKEGKSIWSNSENSQKNGMDRRRAEHGIENTQNTVLKTEKNKYLSVNHVDVNMRDIDTELINSVLKLVKCGNGENQRGILLPGNAKCAERHFMRINIFIQKHADITVLPNSEKRKDVYNLTVENCPEFIANKILVHNCSDSLDYLLTNIEQVKDIFNKQIRWTD